MRWSSSRGEDTDPSDSAFNFAIEHDILDVLTPLLHFIDNARLSGMINEEYLLCLIKLERIATLEVLLRFKERVSITVDTFQSLLHRCIKYPELASEAYIAVLLLHGVDINGKVDEETRLFAAVSANNVGALSSLLNFGAGRTPHPDGTTLAGQTIQKQGSISDERDHRGSYLNMLRALLKFG